LNFVINEEVNSQIRCSLRKKIAFYGDKILVMGGISTGESGGTNFKKYILSDNILIQGVSKKQSDYSLLNSIKLF
jgi:hypothetical protein